jgi:hypothetical protein
VDKSSFFSSVNLFIAPNGGWNPNVLWMRDEACLVELHLIKLDSWLQMFGLSTLFKRGHFHNVTGDFRPLGNLTATSVHKPRNYRGVTDGRLAGSRVAPAVAKALRGHPDCSRFLEDE